MMAKILDWNGYQRSARAFSSYADGTGLEGSLDHIHCASLGLAGEASEAIEYISGPMLGVMNEDLHKIRGELGDVLWYIAELSAAFNISLDALAHLESMLLPSFAAPGQGGFLLYTNLAVWSGATVDYVKKVVHHKHQVDVDKLADLLSRALHAVIELTYFHSFSMEIVANSNLEKLQARYPEGHFTTARSIHRTPE